MWWNTTTAAANNNNNKNRRRRRRKQYCNYKNYIQSVVTFTFKCGLFA